MWSKTKTNRQKLNKPSKYGLLFYLGKCTFSVLSIVPYCLQISLVFITLSVPCPPFSFPPLSKSRQAAPSSVALLPRGIRGAVPSQQQSIYRAPFFCCRQLLRGSFSCFRRRSSPLLTRLLLLSYMMGAAQWLAHCVPHLHVLKPGTSPSPSELEVRRRVQKKVSSKLCPVFLLVLWLTYHHLLHIPCLPSMILAIEVTNPQSLSSEYICHCNSQWLQLC